ncbi:MAG: RNA methyltransferase [Flavobacteriaceae bacterium]|nr:RNA methyltransferase [Bacteroidia bacterium]NNK83687.1 RNA methyltransferase [Flavobacteriaceae bacterium]
MLSKNQIKLITLLKQKKYRVKHNLFVAEGIKTINELLHSDFELSHLYTTTLDFSASDVLTTLISEKELKKISFLKTPNTALALFKIPMPKKIDFSKLVVALDNVKDPGNLGTIIRLCDWFGLDNLICNLETVDCYNPKVIQATMGSIKRINITYTDLSELLNTRHETVFGTFMEGENVYKSNLPENGILVLGNESNGISEDISRTINKKISIPRFGNIKETESLNVANATAILLSEFKRRIIEK